MAYVKYKANPANVSIFNQQKQMVKEKDLTEREMDNFVDWNTYYRRNIHRFIQHHFEVKLHLYQVIWIYFMSISENFVTIASRASAKSWLIALYALAVGSLYSNHEIVIVASSMKQGGIIFGKIGQLKDTFPNIAREIATYSNTSNNWLCILHSGTKIKVVSCTESGRGERSTITIGEEFRIMDKEKFDSIVRPFAYARQCPYMKLKEYEHLEPEEPRTYLISSAYHKNLWWYDETMTTIKMMLDGEKCGFIAFDYLTAIKHGIKTKKQIMKERKVMGEITFLEEYENLPFGENSNSYFKLNEFSENRNIKKPFYPLRNDEFDKKKNPHDIKRQEGEIRIIGVDLASRKGKANDNSIFTCIRALPTTKGYKCELVYMESFLGEHTGVQSLQIKRLFHDFDADYISLDLQNIGISVFERLATVTKDDERGVEYEAFTVFEHKTLDKKLIEELKEKTFATKAKPVIYPVMASARLNSDIAVNFKDKLQRNMISMVTDENEGEDYLTKKIKQFNDNMDVNLKVWYLHPYRQLSELVNECINMEYEVVSGNIKLNCVGTKRRDRYSSASYGCYLASLFDENLLKEETNVDMSQYLFIPNNSYSDDSNWIESYY